MKKCLILTFILINFSCAENNKNSYTYILESLEKNYTINKKISKAEILFCWKLNEDNFKQDSLRYRKAVFLFYKQDIDFLKHLLIFKKDTIHYNQWIESKNPCSSSFTESDATNNSLGSLILIDNFLTNREDILKKNKYIKKINYNKVEELILNNNNINSIKIKYLSYINTL